MNLKELKLLMRLARTQLKRMDRALLELDGIVGAAETEIAPENDREEKMDSWPHARPRQVEGLLDAGMFDFALAGSSPAGA